MTAVTSLYLHLRLKNCWHDLTTGVVRAHVQTQVTETGESPKQVLGRYIDFEDAALLQEHNET